MKLARFGVSCDENLLQQFDRLIAAEGYANRSEALSVLMREHLLQEKITAGEEVVGTVIIVYDHHQRQLSDQLLEIQHRHHSEVLSTLHIHLDHDDCLEVVVMAGRAGQVQELADLLISTRGVKSGRLVIPALRHPR